MPTDKELLDFLQALTDDAEYAGTAIMRESTYSRGWRLHESGRHGAVRDVREAIFNYMKETGWLGAPVDNT